MHNPAEKTKLRLLAEQGRLDKTAPSGAHAKTSPKFSAPKRRRIKAERKFAATKVKEHKFSR